MEDCDTALGQQKQMIICILGNGLQLLTEIIILSYYI